MGMDTWGQSPCDMKNNDSKFNQKPLIANTADTDARQL